MPSAGDDGVYAVFIALWEAEYGESRVQDQHGLQVKKTIKKKPLKITRDEALCHLPSVIKKHAKGWPEWQKWF